MRRIGDQEGRQAAEAWHPQATRPEQATAVRYTLQCLADRAPGGSVEVRVPPYGAVQVIEGAHHRRGTPPAVVEMSPQTWMRLALGQLSWGEAMELGLVDASGQRADLAEFLPLL